MSGGKKFDSEKIPLELLPSEAVEEIGKVLQMGATKYGRANFAEGIEYSRLISAAMRHLLAFNRGEDYDLESNLNHIAHSATNLIFLLYMIKHKPNLDDRWQKKNRV